MDLNKPSAASDSVVLVRCETWREFAEHYADDLANGGMFVATDQQPAALSTLQVRLQLPEATEIVLRARVVQVLDANQASALGKPAGIGLELLDMDTERRRQVYQLVEFARWQGAQNDPNASFARTLLELSPSLAPAEVGQRLSMLPGPAARPSDSSTAVRRPSDSAIRRATDNSGMRRATDSSSAVRRASVGTSDSSPNHAAPRSDAAGAKASPLPDQAQNSARAASISNTNLRSAEPPAATAAPAVPPKPTDPVKLKLVLTEFAHKHYDAVLRVTREMLESNPGDPAALRWQHMSNARLALARDDAQAAVGHYDQALLYDEDNREARDFVRNVRRDQKLNSLPFGRYFTKKK